MLAPPLAATKGCRLRGRVDDTQEILTGPRWQLMAARMQSGLSQSEFARATRVSVRTLQE